jgi:hypothetical protein
VQEVRQPRQQDRRKNAHFVRRAHCRVSSFFFLSFFLKAENGSLSRLDDVQWEMPEVAVMDCGRSEWLEFPERENHLRGGRTCLSALSEHERDQASTSHIYLFTDDHHPLFLAPRKDSIIRRKTPATDKRELERKRSSHEYPPRH